MARKQGTIIPKATMGQILMNAGARRVSAEAIDSFIEVISDIGEDIASRAVKISKHAGRKTVQAGDVKLAAKH